MSTFRRWWFILFDDDSGVGAATTYITAEVALSFPRDPLAALSFSAQSTLSFGLALNYPMEF